MSGNRAVVYKGPGRVGVENIDYPELVLKDGPGVNPLNVGRKCEHGVILKVVSTNICGGGMNTWFAAAPPRRRVWCGTRDDRRGD